jgi:hypothetical protein
MNGTRMARSRTRVLRGKGPRVASSSWVCDTSALGWGRDYRTTVDKSPEGIAVGSPPGGRQTHDLG